MITQIYSIRTIEEARACIEAGADFIGIAAGTDANLPAEITLEKGREIFEFIGGRAGKVLLTVADSPEPIYRAVKTLRPDVVQLCGNRYAATPEFCEKAKKISPGLIVLQAVGITGPEAIEQAVRYSRFCDRLILDSVDPCIPGIGAAGFVNDWGICGQIVERAFCPVILAGGLGPDNVAQAVREVRPWGVDSLTKTNKDGKMEKDGEKIRLFVENARRAARELGL